MKELYGGYCNKMKKYFTAHRSRAHKTDNP